MLTRQDIQQGREVMERMYHKLVQAPEESASYVCVFKDTVKTLTGFDKLERGLEMREQYNGESGSYVRGHYRSDSRGWDGGSANSYGYGGGDSHGYGPGGSDSRGWGDGMGGRTGHDELRDQLATMVRNTPESPLRDNVMQLLNRY